MADKETPEKFVFLRQDRIQTLYAKHSLNIDLTNFGNWRGDKNAVGYQDEVVGTKMKRPFGLMRRTKLFLRDILGQIHRENQIRNVKSDRANQSELDIRIMNDNAGSLSTATQSPAANSEIQEPMMSFYRQTNFCETFYAILIEDESLFECVDASPGWMF